MRSVLMLIVVILLLSTLAGTFYMGYSGIGIAGASSSSVREGSTSGPLVRGGGPSSGK